MDARLLLVALERETDIVLARQRTRAIAELLGFDAQDQTRITTALSEIARNAFEYAGGGRVEFRLAGDKPRQAFKIIVSDRGPGIADVKSVLDGLRPSPTGLGLGLAGARRLTDTFDIETAPGAGTVVTLGKFLPDRAPAVTQPLLKRIAAALAAETPADPNAEIRRQNHELLFHMDELQKRQDALARLNQELQDTNRGVVALYAELDERADHLRRADELKSRFLSNMSHEFRTPLNSILALSRLLLSRSDGELTAEQAKQLEFVRKAAESLTELVNDLLDLAKVEAGRTVVTPGEFTAEGLFGTLRGMLRPLLVGDAVALVFEDPSDVPPLVTDEGKVAQILRNFLSNAIKFTERGEVRIWAAADRQNDTVTFTVRDTGIGIAEPDLEIIFQEFGQVAHPMQARVKGTGLGLPLAKRLAELLGGAVAVASAPGQGSLFSVTLPRLYRRSSEAEGDIAWEVEPGRIPVLAIEDNAADALAFERSLAQSRYQAVPARRIAEAKRALDRIRPAAILLDIVLFGDESWRFLIELKQRDATQHIPIIVVSSTEEERKAISLGADAYLQKPVEAGTLIRALDRMTGQHSTTKILLVDDAEVTRYLVRQLLPRGVYDIKEARNGIEGLAGLREDPPDLVLLDLDMPEMDGYQLLDRLGGDAALVRIPVIILTSMILGGEQRRRLAKASAVLAKSELSAPLLIGAIGDALNPAAERAAQ